jgi:hypothetical protein
MAESARRSIVRSEEFEEQLSGLIPDPEAADEYIAPAEDVLSVNPGLGSSAANVRVPMYILPLQPLRGKTVTLFYSFNADFVFLLYIVAE